MRSFVGKSMISGIVFFFAVGILSFAYGEYVSLTPVDTGSPLTKGIWNQMVGNIDSLDSRVTGISGTIASLSSSVSSLQSVAGGIWNSGGGNVNYTAGNVGIGTATPSQKLEVGGTIYSTSGGFKFPDGTTQTTAASASSGVPTGAVMAFYGTTCPSGWAFADGTANGVKKTDGTTGTLDLRGQFIRGVNTTASGIDPSRTLASTQSSQNLTHTHGGGTLTAASAGAHTHTLGYVSSDSNYHSQGIIFGNDTTTPRVTSSAGAHTHTITGNTAADGSGEARPYNIALLYCVKN